MSRYLETALNAVSNMDSRLPFNDAIQQEAVRAVRSVAEHHGLLSVDGEAAERLYIAIHDYIAQCPKQARS